MDGYLTVAAVPQNKLGQAGCAALSTCGHRSQKRQRTLHRVIFGVGGNVGITRIIFVVIIIIFGVIF